MGSGATLDGFRRTARRRKNAFLLHFARSRNVIARKADARSLLNNRSHQQVLTQLNLVGIGYGTKETGERLTGDMAVRVYVARKIEKSRLSPTELIPSSIDGVLTDVIAIGRPRFHSGAALLGESISHVRGGAGSIGCLVKKQNDESWYLLSACHVLAPAGDAQLGDVILKSEISDANAAELARLADFEPLSADEGVNRFDAAIARIDRKSDVQNRIPVIGALQLPPMNPALFQSARKFGAVSLHTLGVVTDASADVRFVMEGETYFFKDVAQITGAGAPFSDGGDSGAVVVDALSNRPIGLIIGGSGARTFISPLGAILSRFDAELLS
jgi:hypothetical protein